MAGMIILSHCHKFPLGRCPVIQFMAGLETSIFGSIKSDFSNFRVTVRQIYGG